jgi:hypothetical protein
VIIPVVAKVVVRFKVRQIGFRKPFKTVDPPDRIDEIIYRADGFQDQDLVGKHPYRIITEFHVAVPDRLGQSAEFRI